MAQAKEQASHHDDNKPESIPLPENAQHSSKEKIPTDSITQISQTQSAEQTSKNKATFEPSLHNAVELVETSALRQKHSRQSQSAKRRSHMSAFKTNRGAMLQKTVNTSKGNMIHAHTNKKKQISINLHEKNKTLTKLNSTNKHKFLNNRTIEKTNRRYKRYHHYHHWSYDDPPEHYHWHSEFHNPPEHTYGKLGGLIEYPDEEVRDDGMGVARLSFLTQKYGDDMAHDITEGSKDVEEIGNEIQSSGELNLEDK